MKNYIVIAGNIGSGKTTLAQKLAKSLSWDIFVEPFEANPYLELFYQDMKTWAFHSQLFFLLNKFKALQNINHDQAMIQDRGLFEDAEIFARHLYLQGYISENDWRLYNELYDNFRIALDPPQLVVYLQSSPQRCLNNVITRGRAMENNIDLNYLSQLNDLYDQWVNNYAGKIIVAPTDDCDFKLNESHYSDLLEKIKQTIMFTPRLDKINKID